MKVSFEFTQFGAKDVERISGTSMNALRDWRRHGYLPKKPGHPKFNCIELIEVWAMNMLAHRGIGPRLTTGIAKQCGIVGAWFALREPHAYEGGPKFLDNVLPRMAENFSDSEQRDIARRFVPALEGDTPQKYIEGLSSTPFGGRTKWLANEIIIGRQEEPPDRFVVWMPNNKWMPSDSLDNISVLLEEETGTFGFLISLDLETLGRLLVQRAEKPLVEIDVLEE